MAAAAAEGTSVGGEQEPITSVDTDVRERKRDRSSSFWGEYHCPQIQAEAKT